MNNIMDDFKKENCCGCLSCVNSCPTGALYISKDEYGFTIPKIDREKCINCGKCVLACPYNNKELFYNIPKKAYAAINKNSNVILKSSSGGIFYSLAEEIIRKNGYVFGATMDEHFQVKHICINGVNEICKLQKSKYIQSNTEDVYKTIQEKLLLNKKVLFTGTPCQIAGLLTFLKNKKTDNLICVDMVCHGVPNQEFFNDYLKCLESKVGKIENYEFRTKKRSRNGMNWFFSYKIKNKNKKIIKNWPEDSYNYLYMKSLIYRDSCYNCKFINKKRNSDITLCDYWGWKEYHHKEFHDLDCVSGCIINSKKGQELFDSIKENLIYKETSYDIISKHNKCLKSSEEMNPKRNEILKLWKDRGYKELDNQFRKKMKIQILKYHIKNIIPESIKEKLKK